MLSFLQSAEWQEVQERMGRPTRRIAGALVIRHDLPFGLHYLYAPRLPALPPEFFREAALFGQETGAVFLKIDPADARFEIRNLRPGPRSGDLKLEVRPGHSLQPNSIILIDCVKPEAELLAAMHPKTRYNIRLAERHGVVVRAATDAGGELDRIWPLFRKTARREQFSLHPQRHYQILLEIKSDVFANELWLAELGGEPLAAAIINGYRPAGTVTYLHGASNRTRRGLMAPYLLHWRIICSARERGFQTYDLGGIDEERWPGLTRFKRGFGGTAFAHPASSDIVFRPVLYRIYRLQRAVRQ